MLVWKPEATISGRSSRRKRRFLSLMLSSQLRLVLKLAHCTGPRKAELRRTGECVEALGDASCRCGGEKDWI